MTICSKCKLQTDQDVMNMLGECWACAGYSSTDSFRSAQKPEQAFGGVDPEPTTRYVPQWRGGRGTINPTAPDPNQTADYSTQLKTKNEIKSVPIREVTDAEWELCDYCAACDSAGIVSIMPLGYWCCSKDSLDWIASHTKLKLVVVDVFEGRKEWLYVCKET
jgi:hypothetical protein